MSKLKELAKEIEQEARDIHSDRYWREHPGTPDDYFYGWTSGRTEPLPDAADSRTPQVIGTVSHAIGSALQTTVDHAAACVHVCNRRGLFPLRLNGENRTYEME
jgi:hypothetical protein